MPVVEPQAPRQAASRGLDLLLSGEQAQLPPAGGGESSSAVARLFIMLMLARLAQDAGLFDLPLEPPQSGLKSLVVSDLHFSQIIIPPSGQ